MVQIERPGVGDILRSLGLPLENQDGPAVGTMWVQDRRNTFFATLDFSVPEGRDLFLRMVAGADIWMESSKAGTYTKWGLDDATVLATNPKLVITHVSGYGQNGHPGYVNRASYDPIGQAFGGTMGITGPPDPEPPMVSNPLAGDYATAHVCLWSSLAAYIHAQRTGQGQVIDLAQFEAVHRGMSNTMIDFFELGVSRERQGNQAGRGQPFSNYRAKDGWVAIAAVGTVFNRVCAVVGLDPTDEFAHDARTNSESKAGVEFAAVLQGWLDDRTVHEVVEIMNAAQVGCSAVMTPNEIAEDPHYRAREVHTEWDDLQLGRRVKGIGILPKFSETPGNIWRGSGSLGHDNALVYRSYLGMDDEELKQLQERGVI